MNVTSLMILLQQTINNISQGIKYDSQKAPFKHHVEEYTHTLQCSNNRKYQDPKIIYDCILKHTMFFIITLCIYRECLQDVTFYDKHKLCLAKMVQTSINNYILMNWCHNYPNTLGTSVYT